MARPTHPLKQWRFVNSVSGADLAKQLDRPREYVIAVEQGWLIPNERVRRSLDDITGKSVGNLYRPPNRHENYVEEA